MNDDSRIRRLFRLPSTESTVARDVDDEIAFHIEARATDLMACGYSAEDARRIAEREFGDVAGARSELASIDRVTVRRERRASWRDALRQDAVLALRGMGRDRAFTLTVVVTLALGIGVNSAMFGITDRLLLSAPPHVVDPDNVVRVLYEHSPVAGERVRSAALPYPDYALLRSVGAFAETGAYFPTMAVLGVDGVSTEIRLGQATATFFSLLGVQPAHGRFFRAEEDAVPRGLPVVVLSHALWQSRFGGDRRVIGSMVDIDNGRYEVIGVAPRGFNGIELQPIDAWVPVSAVGRLMGGEEWYAFRGLHYLRAVARLRDGVEAAAARAQASAVFVAGNAERFAGDTMAKVLFGNVIAARAPVTERSSSQRSGQIALWLLGVSLLVVLIACVNVTNLLLARGMRRQRAIGVRIALGIGRARLAAQTLTETLLISLCAAVLGLVLAHWAGQLARGILLPDVEWTGSPVSRRVVLFTAASALLCALLASLAPALHAMRTSVHTLLGPGGRSTYRGSRLRSGLVALQATLSVLLLIGAGLFLRSLREAGRIALGYEPDRVVAFSYHNRGLDWNRERTLALYDASLQRVRSLPQVEAAALSITEPLWSMLWGFLRVPGLDSIPTTRAIISTSVSVDYFRTVGARVLQGRAFTPQDVTGTASVALVTESLARLLWPRESALGKCIITSAEQGAPCREVVGVVEDTRYHAVLEEPALMYYLPLAQVPGRGSMRGLLVRMRGDIDAGIRGVREALRSLEPNLPYLLATPLQDRVAPELMPWRLGAVLFSAFGALALALAGLGLYGVVAYDVAQRRREVGVRMALGARAANVLRMVLGDAVRVIVSGLVTGVVAAVVAARWVEPLLFHVSARDPLVHAAVAGVLLVSALVAATLPAVRAARLQPTEALRDD
jgi:predicted permease